MPGRMSGLPRCAVAIYHELASRFGGCAYPPTYPNVRRPTRCSWQHARIPGEHRVAGQTGPQAGLGAVPALALRVRADGAQEVDLAEVGPVGLAEVELALRRLPEQEPAEALLPGGTDHQVGVGLTLRVEVLGDVLDVDRLGHLLEAAAALGLALEQRPHRVGDLAPAAVRDGHVDQHALHVGGRLHGLLQAYG